MKSTKLTFALISMIQVIMLMLIMHSTTIAQCPATCTGGTYPITSNSSTNYTLGNSESLSIQEGYTYSGTVTINGTGTQINNCGTFAGTLTYTSGAFIIVNSGTWNTTAKLTLPNSSSLVNCSAGTYTKTGSADGIELTGTGILHNDGTMSLSATGASSKALLLSGSGAVTNDGTLTLHSMLDITGSTTLTNNYKIDIYRDGGSNSGTGILNMGTGSNTINNYSNLICHDNDASNLANAINNYGYMEFYNLGMSASIMVNDCRIKMRNNFTNSGYGSGASLGSGYRGKFEIGGTSTNSAYFGIDAYQTTYTSIDFCDVTTSNGGHFDTNVGYLGTSITYCTNSGSCPSYINPDAATLSVSITPSASSICDGSSSTLSTTVSNGTPSYSYSWAVSSGTAPSGASPSVSPTTSTTYTVTVTDNASATATATTVITVNSIPTANAGSDVAICTGASTNLTATGGGTYVWSTSATTASITVSPTTATTYSVTVTNNSCTATDNVVITVNANPTANTGSDVAICNGASTSLTATGGGTYLWSNDATTAIISVSPTTTTTYSVTVTSNNCTSTDNVVVTVNSIPTANAGNDIAVCIGASTNLTATGGGTYVWSTTETTAGITVSPTTATTYSVTVTSNSCTSTDNVVVTVNAIPTANAGSDVAICNGASTSLTASGGTTYLWSTSETTASITVSPTTATSYTVTVTLNSCTSTDNVVVTINESPTANAGSDVVICNGASTNLTATGGGTYEWNTNATTASIEVSPSTTTTYTVTVTSNNCIATDNVVVTVNAYPTANAGANQTICSGTTTQLTASGGTTYSWSTNASTAIISVNPTTTSIYTVTAYNGTCSNADDIIITVNPKPILGINDDITINSGFTTTINVTGASSYLWNTSATTSTLTISPTTTTTYSVTGSLSNGCSSTEEVVVNVVSLSNNPCEISILESNFSCSGGKGRLLSNTIISNNETYWVDQSNELTNITLGGGTLIICGNLSVNSINLNDGKIIIKSGGTLTISSTTTNINCDIYNYGTLNLSGSALVYGGKQLFNASNANLNIKNANTTLQIDGQFINYGIAEFYKIKTQGPDQRVCLNTNSTTNVTNIESQPLTWEAPNGIACVNLKGAATLNSGNFTSSSMINICKSSNATVTGNGTWGSATVLENCDYCNAVLSNAGSNQEICLGESANLTATGGASYIWSTGATTSTIAVTPTTTTTYTVSIATATQSVTDNVVVTVNSLPPANAGSDMSICAGTSTNLTATGGEEYFWSTNESTASTSVSPTETTTFYVTVTSSTNCSSMDSIVITVNSYPTTNTESDVSVCIGQSINLTAPSGETYVWSNSETTGIITIEITTASTYTVTINSNECTASQEIVVTVNSNPTASVGSDVEICNGQSANLSATGGSTYVWSTLYETAGLTVSPTITTTYTVTVTNEFDCTATDEVVVIVNNLPSVNAGDDLTICKGASMNLSATGGVTYIWNTTETSAAITVTPTTATTYTVTATSSTGCSATDEIVVSVSPIINAGNDVTICIGASTNLTATGGVTYIWNITDTTATISVTPTSTTTYSVTATDNNSCSASDEVVVTVNSYPTANAGEDVTICSGTSTTLSAQGGNTYQWNTNENTVTNIVSPSQTTTYSVTVSNAIGCTDIDDVVVTVIPSPTATIQTSDVAVTQGKSTTLTVSGNGTYLWFNSSTDASITVTPTNTTSYIVTVTATNGCTTSADIVILININSTTPFSGDVSGNINTIKVTGIQGRAVSDTMPRNGQLMKWDSIANKWMPSNDIQNLKVHNNLVIGDSSIHIGVMDMESGGTSGSNNIWTTREALWIQYKTTEPTYATLINAFLGNVGIGLRDNKFPAEKLEVNGNIKISGGAQFGNGLYKFGLGSIASQDLAYGSFIGFNARLTGDNWIFDTDTYHNGGSVILGDCNGEINFYSVVNSGGGGTMHNITNTGLATLKVMRMYDKGLDVKGTVKAQHIVVTLNQNQFWPDFVFDKNYKLRSLYDLEKFVKCEKHLPEIPTAKEVKQNGIDVEEINAKMLQKIEEFSLYLIDLNKQIDGLKADNEKMKKELNALRK